MSHCHSINEGPVLQPWLSSSTSASEDAVIDLYKRTSLSARAARSVSGDTQNRRHSPVAWLPVSFIMTRTSTEGKLRWHDNAPYSSGRLGGPINSYMLFSADSTIHDSDTFEHANVPSDTMHGGIKRASATTQCHHRY